MSFPSNGQPKDPWVYSYSGRKVGPYADTPSLLDVAVALGRTCRYAGNGTHFYTTLLHSFVVADLLPDPLKVYGLLHDANDSVTGDIPKPFKLPALEEIERRINDKVLIALELPLPSETERAEIKRADRAALVGEVWTVGAAGLRAVYPDRRPDVEATILAYVLKYPPAMCINPTGLAVADFGRRYRHYRSLIRSAHALDGSEKFDDTVQITRPRC